MSPKATLANVMQDEIRRLEDGRTIAQVLSDETGLTPEDVDEAFGVTSEPGAYDSVADNADLTPEAAFVAGILVGKRHQEWSDR
jgi:hypothetical protein